LKVGRTTSDSLTENRDGSTARQLSEILYSYINTRLASATGTGSSLSNDGYGNFVEGIFGQLYEVIRGQAKLIKTSTLSFTSNANGEGSFNDILTGIPTVKNADGSFSFQSSENINQYNPGGRLVAAQGRVASLSNDGSGNWTASGKIDLTAGPTSSTAPRNWFEPEVSLTPPMLGWAAALGARSKISIAPGPVKK
jgi:hypothetical protein